MPGPRSDDFADRLPPAGKGNRRVQVIFRLIMSVLGEASAGMRWAGTCSEWPVLELHWWPLLVAQGVVASGTAFCRTWNWKRGLFSEPVVLEVILARSGWLAST